MTNLHPAFDAFRLSEFWLLLSLSFWTCAILVLLSKRNTFFSGDPGDLIARQATHDSPTPRFGGLWIFVAVLTGSLYAPGPIATPDFYFVMATGFLFLVGLLEDVRVGVSPAMRLLACCISGALVIWLLQVWMPRIGIPGLDDVMHHWWIGVPVTILITSAVANGFNLIDGVNGLAAFTAIITALTLALISHHAGYEHMEFLSVMFAAGILGFLLLNFPFGLIFLGDAGAYTLGFVLSWFGVSILLNAPTASPWALLLTMFWPLADTLLAILRRMRRNSATTAPDRLHVHQMVMRALEIHVLGRGQRRIANPLSTVVLAPFIMVPPLVGVLFWDQNLMAFLAVLIILALFFGSYAGAFLLLKHLPRKRVSY